MSPFFLLVGIYNFRGRFQLAYPLCIALSSYFLYDAYKGWIALALASTAFDENDMNWILGLNAGVIFCAIFLWFLGSSIAQILHAVPSLILRWLLMLAMCAAWITFGCYQVHRIGERNPDWVNRNIGYPKDRYQQNN